MRKVLKGAAIVLAGLFLWTASPLAAKPPAGSPAAARPAATPKKHKKPRRSRHEGREGKHK